MTRPTIIAISLLVAILALGALIASMGPEHALPSSLLIRSAPTASSKLPVLSDTMPTFRGITQWWNTPNDQALTTESLKGKVVLVDFWTYSCINCIRTYPFLKSLYAAYADKGFVIVGVHTPEFAFEADPNNVDREIKKNGLLYPIALDGSYATWNAYQNNSWPAEYLFDQQGRLRHISIGEGQYNETETAIRSLLAEDGAPIAQANVAMPVEDFSKIQTHETYFGLARGEAFMGTTGQPDKATTFIPADTVQPNQWTAGGTWIFRDEYVESAAVNDVFRFSIQAAQAHLVLASSDGTDKTIEVFVDGTHLKDLTINASTLYTIADFPDAGRHVIEIRIKQKGVRFYAATFS